MDIIFCADIFSLEWLQYLTQQRSVCGSQILLPQALQRGIENQGVHLAAL